MCTFCVTSPCLKNEKKHMNRYVKLILKWILVFFATSLVAFAIVRITPGSPVDITLTNLGLPKTEENVKAIEKLYHFDEPLIKQYFSWMKDFLSGEWGKSYLTQSSLKPEIFSRLPLSFGIGIGGIFLAMALSFGLGYKASLNDKGVYNYISRALTLMSQTMPVFLIILLTIYFLGVKFQVMKFFTNVTPEVIILAVIFVAFPMIGPMSRAVRVHFKETAESMFMQYYTLRGYDSKKALLKYGSRPALYGLFSIAISKFSSVIGGATVVEYAMALPGLSTFLIESISRRDYPMVQSYIMILVLWMFLVNIVFEFIMGRILKREVSS